MNLSEIEAAIYARLSFTSTPSSDVISRLRGHVNSTQRAILGQKQCSKLRRATLTFSSVADSEFAVLPQVATKIYSIVDPTNQWPMNEVDIADIRINDPGLSAGSATPYAWAVDNMSAAAAKQPSNASQLFAKSTSASDDSTKTLYVEGVTTGGYYRTASVAMNGTTAVSFTPTDFILVTKFYVNLTAAGTASAAGVITLHEDSGVGTELSRIPVGRSYPRYTRIVIYPKPTAAVVYNADVDLHVENMSEETDEPYLPEDFHEVLVEGALMREYERREKPILYAQARSRYRDILGDMKLYIAKKSSVTVDISARYSQLGPYYPPGS